MRRTLTIIGHEFLVNLRRPAFILMTLAVPLLGGLALIVGGHFGGRIAEEVIAPQRELAKKSMGYVDQTGRFAPKPGFTLYLDEEKAKVALLSEEVSSFFVIPQDYMDTGVVIRYSRGEGLLGSDPDSLVWQAVRNFLIDNLLADEPDPQVVARIKNPMNTVSLTLDESGALTQETPFNFIIPFIFSVLLIMSIFAASGFLLQSVAEEKENRVIEILLSSVSPGQLMVGKIVGLGALGLTQVLVWLVSAWVITSIGSVNLPALQGLSIPISTLLLAGIYFILGYLLYGAIMAGCGAIATTMREGQQIAGIFSMAAAVPMMFSSLLIMNPDSTFAVALSYFPLTAPTMVMQRIGLQQVPAYQLAISLSLLFLSVPLVIWMAAKVFRMGLLMYGKRPTLGEIVRVLR